MKVKVERTTRRGGALTKAPEDDPQLKPGQGEEEPEKQDGVEVEEEEEEEEEELDEEQLDFLTADIDTATIMTTTAAKIAATTPTTAAVRNLIVSGERYPICIP